MTETGEESAASGKSAAGFTDFDLLCSGSVKGYSYNLAKLFDDIQCGKTDHMHPIEFDMAFKRSKRKIKETIKEIQIQSGRKVIKFTIGKTYARTRKSGKFDPMRPSSWRLDSGINGRWKNEYEKHGFDGLVVIGCIVLDLIPENVRQNVSWIDQEKYALGLEQALIQYYTLHKKDARLGNKSFNTGGDAKNTPKSGIIYMAYKLENPEIEEKEKEDESTDESNLTVALEALKTLLYGQRKLVIRREYSSYTDSLFRACSDQLERSEFRLDHNIHPEGLKSAVLNQLKLDTEEHLPREEANALVEEIEQSRSVKSDILIDILAKYIKRKIIVYTRSDYIAERSYESTTRKSPPLLLAMDDLYFHSLGESKDEDTSELHKTLNSAIKRKSARSNIPHENNNAKKSKEINWTNHPRDSNLVGTHKPATRKASVESAVSEWQENEPSIQLKEVQTGISEALALHSIEMNADISVTAFFVLRTINTIWYKIEIDPVIKMAKEYYAALKANSTRSTDIAIMTSSVEPIYGEEFYKKQKLCADGLSIPPAYITSIYRLTNILTSAPNSAVTKVKSNVMPTNQSSKPTVMSTNQE